jgi:DNA polymerase-3 subunit delta
VSSDGWKLSSSHVLGAMIRSPDALRPTERAAYNGDMFLLLYGPDDFSAAEELARLRATGGFEHNQDTFDGQTADLGTLRAVCDTMPFLSERRLVILNGLPKRKRTAQGEASEDGDESADAAPPETGKRKAKGPDPKAFIAGLAEYVPRVPETTALVILVPEALEETHPLVEAAKRYGTARAFTPPKGSALEDWLAKRAKANGATLSREASRLLVESLGSDQRQLALEVDKLATYAGQGGHITIETVRALTPVARQGYVFDLTDALARRDRARALTLLHELLAQGESPLGIVAITATQTRAMLKVKSLSERGMRPFQIAQQTGLNPFVVEKSLPLARQFTFEELEATHRRLLDVDLTLKRSRMTPEMALDLLVLEFGLASA